MSLLLHQVLEWCGLLVMFLSTLFWRHITAEHPLLRHWCSDTFLQIWWRNKLILIMDGLKVSTFSAFCPSFFAWASPVRPGVCIYEVNRVHSDSSRSAVTEMNTNQEHKKSGFLLQPHLKAQCHWSAWKWAQVGMRCTGSRDGALTDVSNTAALKTQSWNSTRATGTSTTPTPNDSV